MLFLVALHPHNEAGQTVLPAEVVVSDRETRRLPPESSSERRDAAEWVARHDLMGNLQSPDGEAAKILPGVTSTGSSVSDSLHQCPMPGWSRLLLSHDLLLQPEECLLAALHHISLASLRRRFPAGSMLDPLFLLVSRRAPHDIRCATLAERRSAMPNKNCLGTPSNSFDDGAHASFGPQSAPVRTVEPQISSVPRSSCNVQPLWNQRLDWNLELSLRGVIVAWDVRHVDVTQRSRHVPSKHGVDGPR